MPWRRRTRRSPAKRRPYRDGRPAQRHPVCVGQDRELARTAQATTGTWPERAVCDVLPGHPLARHIDDFLTDLADANKRRSTIRAYRGIACVASTVGAGHRPLAAEPALGEHRNGRKAKIPLTSARWRPWMLIWRRKAGLGCWSHLKSLLPYLNPLCIGLTTPGVSY
jgi:hypothetical protein